MDRPLLYTPNHLLKSILEAFTSAILTFRFLDLITYTMRLGHGPY